MTTVPESRLCLLNSKAASTRLANHVRIGVRILAPIPCFREALPVIAQHHEWFDGSGYPMGLAREGISLLGRILAVSDTYDSVVSDRPYRKGLSRAESLETLRRASGRQFDPEIVTTFIQLQI